MGLYYHREEPTASGKIQVLKEIKTQLDLLRQIIVEIGGLDAESIAAILTLLDTKTEAALRIFGVDSSCPWFLNPIQREIGLRHLLRHLQQMHLDDQALAVYMGLVLDLTVLRGIPEAEIPRQVGMAYFQQKGIACSNRRWQLVQEKAARLGLTGKSKPSPIRGEDGRRVMYKPTTVRPTDPTNWPERYI